MSDNDDDNIEFDFFEEPTPEPPPRRGLRPRRPDGPGRPPVGPAPGVAPLLRLLGLIAAAIAVVLLLATGLKSCQSSSTTDAYKHYMEQVDAVATASERQGDQLAAIPATPSLTEKELEGRLAGLVTSSGSAVSTASEIHPPGPLRGQHEDMLEALQLRQAGLAALLAGFEKTAAAKKANGIGATLAEQTSRFAASDVIWLDLFQKASTVTLSREGIHGVLAPSSVFLSKPQTLDATSLGNLWTRVHGSGTKSNAVRGTALVGVRAESPGTPGTTDLSTTTETTLRATTNLQFVVTVKDTGELQEANVKVTIKILQTPAIEKSGVIPLINPGETKTVTIKCNCTPTFNQPLTLQVRVAPVTNEARLGNNSADYPVVFTI